jgi:hypothetical protein
MQRPILVATSLLFAVAVLAVAENNDRGVPPVRRDQLLAEFGVWDLARDFKIDGKLEDTQKLESFPLELSLKGTQLSGHFIGKKVGDEVNDSVFSGEIVTREKPLLILRQQANRDGIYVVIHAGHLIGENHYRGVWHDNSGQSGDFELKLRK